MEINTDGLKVFVFPGNDFDFDLLLLHYLNMDLFYDTFFCAFVYENSWNIFIYLYMQNKFASGFKTFSYLHISWWHATSKG